MTDTEKMKEILGFFGIPGEPVEAAALGNGHINDTRRLSVRTEHGEKRYVLQRINRHVFRRPEELMENMTGVTDFLRKRIVARGGDPERETLSPVISPEGFSCYRDGEGEYWRITAFIEGTICREKAEDAESFRMTGRAFGNFLRELADFPAAALHETIPGFHDTRARFRQFERAAAEDAFGRADSCRDETAFLMGRRELSEFAMKSFEDGRLPLRVTHNDTKLNNILLDARSGEALCILDLDTVMPGFSIYDFGDGIRTGASTALEDERDLSRVHLDLDLYRAFLEGYLEGCGEVLTAFEKNAMPMGAVCITYEQAIRFLTDYLSGDVYYKTDYPEQNLVRARTQIRLLQEMEERLGRPDAG